MLVLTKDVMAWDPFEKLRFISSMRTVHTEKHHYFLGQNIYFNKSRMLLTMTYYDDDRNAIMTKVCIIQCCKNMENTFLRKLEYFLRHAQGYTFKI